MAVYRIYDLTTASSFECPDDKCILDAAESAGLDFLPYSCRAGACTTCVALRISGRVDQSDAAFLTEKEKELFVITCVAYPSSDCVIRTGAESLFYDQQRALQQQLTDQEARQSPGFWF
ncbi:ferredoxin [Brenneria roseae subsp. americana]|uniref:Ferredoxin n=1 Tax=Brenneria roseae subsp. americana TaxID=1508507 RepID=A0A2U1TXW8_9GAMM|nr:2Fe-2S iron-sulfur cluster-binding protein [Brenneria roseae]PWC14224.1 ferredoxin [Brenneria roseae subsp. americana]